MPATQTIAVFSAMRGLGWQGCLPADVADDLEKVFRYFNRVDEPDVERLGRIGYNLPSMSGGDLIGRVRGDGYVDWWLCASAGWERISDGQAQTYMYRATYAYDHNRRPPMFAKVDGDVLKSIMDNKEGHTVWAHIAWNGYVTEVAA
jgi:hypothetical protein